LCLNAATSGRARSTSSRNLKIPPELPSGSPLVSQIPAVSRRQPGRSPTQIVETRSRG
jgi:hypothetical protein